MLLYPLKVILLYLASTFVAVNAAPLEEMGISLSPKSDLNPYNLLTRALPTGTCDADTPCPIAACCGTNGLCGFSPSECGAGNCTSKCDSKADCGQYGVAGKQKCPLNVCCSKFGFCGETNEFCDTGCQAGFGGCGPPKRPSCGGSGGVSKRTIGYYEAWSNTRKCQNVAPEDLNLNGFTHVNFAFAFFDPLTFAIAPMDGKTGQLYNRFTALKGTYSGLQTWISVGGWSFTDPGPTRTAFSEMTSSSGNRAKFINELKKFMQAYGFDGADLDWEYPQADDRGGSPGDTVNYVSLVKEMRASFGTKYGISVTLPTSYWYLQHFDLPGMQDSVDWFNLMSYDLHGVWDAESKFVGPYIAPHTNITEIDAGLDLLWRAGVKSGKVVLGQGWYGRSFTLKDPSCNKPNGVCEFSGGANAGPCSNAEGILDLQEIKDIISKNKLSPTWDKIAGVKWITWSGNQWVSYDDDDTFRQKRDFASSRCLGGLMVWAIDQVDQKADNGLAPAPGVTTSDQQDAKQKSDNLQAGVTCYATECEVDCKKGTNKVAQMNGQPGQLLTNGRCDKGKYRNLCCDDGTTMGICQWRGYRGVGLSCMGGCNDGETEVIQDTNHKEKKGDQTCTGGMQSYCCKGFKPAPNGADLVKDAGELAKAAAEAAAEQAALDIAAKAFCRIAVPALLAPLELLEDLIPIIGEILDIAEIAATPALIQVCVKGIEKEGQAEFKVFGKKHTLTMDKPTTKPSATRPPESSHTSAKTSSDSCPQQPKFVKRAPNARPCRKKTVLTTTAIQDGFSAVASVADCNGLGNAQQACLHYSSVINAHAGYDMLTCPFSRPVRTYRPAVSNEFDVDRPRAVGWTARIPYACQRDEYPPALCLKTNDGYMGMDGHAARDNTDRQQYIRFIQGADNGSGGQIWSCPQITDHHDVNGNSHEEVNGGVTTVYQSVRAVYTRKVIRVVPVVPAGVVDAGLGDNVCQPRRPNVDDRGYALLNRDPWFAANAVAAALTPQYRAPPTGFAKRDTLDPNDIAIMDGNSSRRLTDEELRRDFGVIKCADRDCTKELDDLGIESILVDYMTPPSSPAEATATSTSTSVSTVATEDVEIVLLKSRQGATSGNFPRQTAKVEH